MRRFWHITKKAFRTAYKTGCVFAWPILIALWIQSYVAGNKFDSSIDAWDRISSSLPSGGKMPPLPDLPEHEMMQDWWGQHRQLSVLNMNGFLEFRWHSQPVGHYPIAENLEVEYRNWPPPDNASLFVKMHYVRYYLGYTNAYNYGRRFFSFAQLYWVGAFHRDETYWELEIPFWMLAVLLAIPTSWSLIRLLRKRFGTRHLKAFPVLEKV